jgi:hypothetical protein
MGSVEITEPVGLVHPRAASVTVLSASRELTVSEITTGTLHLRLDLETDLARRPFASLALKVDGSFVTVTVPRVLDVDCLRDALSEALPDGYLVIAHPSSEAVVLTIARATEVEPTPHLFCTSFDGSLRARKVGPNRLLVRGTARGNGELQLRVNDRELRVRPARGERPLEIAERLRALLAESHITLLAVPSEADGDVVLTVLPRR